MYVIDNLLYFLQTKKHCFWIDVLDGLDNDLGLTIDSSRNQLKTKRAMEIIGNDGTSHMTLDP